MFTSEQLKCSETLWWKDVKKMTGWCLHIQAHQSSGNLRITMHTNKKWLFLICKMFSSYKGIFGKYCFHVKAPLKTVSMLYFSMFAYTGNIVFFSVLRWHKLNKYCIFYIYILTKVLSCCMEWHHLCVAVIKQHWHSRNICVLKTMHSCV